ncbi:unnamed protein product, partial [Brassica oleracea]
KILSLELSLYRHRSQALSISLVSASVSVSSLQARKLTLSMAIDECPGIRRSVCKEISNMDMFEAEFGGVVVTGDEGWSAQHGEASLNSRVGEDDGD